ncbi:hypothetical protein [Bradyrhizobium sp. ARR65]|uniref:hypothetical protein n=1 Tax=Bradyrhizobium sp. ARR65 TaxID=1040989 RepID=UPI000462FE9F|nr:hypothetical protein [Bradyrhizobium sp. ARR65]
MALGDRLGGRAVLEVVGLSGKEAREVKVALSGLFERFVGRAYLEPYFDLSIFAHLGSRVIDLDRRRQVKVTRLSRSDLPDWIACASDLSSLTVAERGALNTRRFRLLPCGEYQWNDFAHRVDA